MLDDQRLSALLHESGDSYAVPVSGTADILHRARQGDDEGGAPETVPADLGDGVLPAPPTRWGTIRSLRLLSVAAALIVLLVVVGAAVWFGNTAPVARTASGPKAAAHSLSTGDSGSNARSSKATSGSAALAAPAAKGSAPATRQAPGAPALPLGEVGQSAKIEQTGSLELTVAKGALSTTMTKLTSLATAYGGFVANSQTQSSTSGGAVPSGTVTVQIPVASFSNVLKAAQSLGKASQLTTKATDVTGQYVDLQSQITALQASRQQYLTIMTKASSIGDVLAVQAQLDSLQTQIQQLQGQLAVIASETSYSTLTVTVGEASPSLHPVAPARTGVAKAWHDSVHGFVEGIEGLIRIAGPVLFVLLCLAVLGLGSRIFWRRLQRHNL